MTRMSKNEKAVIIHDKLEIALGTLAANTAILGVTKIDASLENGFRCLKVQLTANMIDKTAAEGPIDLYLAFNPDNAAWCIESLDADPQSRFDRNSIEPAMRPLFFIGTFSWAMLEGLLGDVGGALPIEVKPQWSAPEGGSMSFVAVNRSPTSALTTGAKILIRAKYFGVWLED